MNDQYGHARGDALLCQVAARIRQEARQGDLVFRLGGDEFAVLAQGVASSDQALELGKRLVAAAALGDSTTGDVHIGASAGVRLLTRDGASRAVNEADAALYAAKNSGRGHAVLWDRTLSRHLLGASLEPARPTNGSIGSLET